MALNRDSISFSALRSLIVAICTILGIGIGLFLLILALGAFESKSQTLEPELKAAILPDANFKREPLASSGPVVLQIDLQGIIGLEALNMKSVQQQLLESREGDLKGDRVKAILIVTNTPGGTVVDANGIYSALKGYKERFKVPVYMFVDGLCASGGMYVASAADKVYATDSSIIGSVGVLIPTFMNFSQTLEKIGVQTLSLYAGKDKDAMNPLRPWKPGEDENYRQILDYYYEQFVNLVTQNRPQVNKEKLIDVYGARVFPASEAKSIGFIDEAGKTREEALSELVKAAGLEGEKYQVVRLESSSWLADILKAESPLFTGKVDFNVRLNGDVEPELMGKFLYLYRP